MARSNATSKVDRLRTALENFGLQGIELDWEIVTLCMRLKNLTIQTIAVGAGLSVTTMPQVKYRRMPRYEEAIAEALGVRPAELWPSRYEQSTISLSEEQSHA